MGSLYVSGSQCIYAALRGDDDYEIFDAHERRLKVEAHRLGLFIERIPIGDYGSTAFLIGNHAAKVEELYSGECFNIDFVINESSTFAERASQMVAYLNEVYDIQPFKGLEWNKPAVRYSVTS